MATSDQLAQLRLLINEPTNVEPWTDDTLGLLIDANNGDIRLAAAQVWDSKAAGVAHLVDISEGGSSRKMSDLYKNFLAIAAGFRSTDNGQSTTTRAPRTREITRS